MRPVYTLDVTPGTHADHQTPAIVHRCQSHAERTDGCGLDRGSPLSVSDRTTAAWALSASEGQHVCGKRT